MKAAKSTPKSADKAEMRAGKRTKNAAADKAEESAIKASASDGMQTIATPTPNGLQRCWANFQPAVSIPKQVNTLFRKAHPGWWGGRMTFAELLSGGLNTQ